MAKRRSRERTRTGTGKEEALVGASTSASTEKVVATGVDSTAVMRRCLKKWAQKRYISRAFPQKTSTKKVTLLGSCGERFVTDVTISGSRGGGYVLSFKSGVSIYYSQPIVEDEELGLTFDHNEADRYFSVD